MTGSELPEHWFQRADETPDGHFYREPRFVAHIDQATIDALTDFYRERLPTGGNVLDLMSSWISHLPPEVGYGRVAGLGMNEAELAANARLDDHVVHDLNADSELPYPDACFDRVLIAVSVQYLTRPVDVMRSVHRVLRAGGGLCIAMSHRLFPTKAVLAFQALDPQQRIELVAGFLHAAGFDDIGFEDRSPRDADPLWIVCGWKK